MALPRGNATNTAVLQVTLSALREELKTILYALESVTTTHTMDNDASIASRILQRYVRHAVPRGLKANS